MNFGKYAVITPVVHHFEKEPDWTWTLKPTTSRDEIEMAKFMTKSGESLTWLEIAFREIALSFGGTNIEIDKKPILHPDATVAQVEAVLAEMTVDMVTELWVVVGEANPFWGPRKPQKAQTETSS